jgi:hypothetical protein
MAYYGKRPWHGLGTNIPDRANASRTIGAAGLNWEVAMRSIPNVGAHAGKKAFEFFDPIIGDSETAGSLGNGERIWVLAKATTTDWWNRKTER